jgi:subtilisin family serine protease
MKTNKKAVVYGFLFMFSLGARATDVSKGQDRFIISSEFLDSLSRAVKSENLTVEKKMKFQKALVVTTTEKKAAELASRFSGHYERDVIFSLPEIFGKNSGSGSASPVQPPETLPWGISKIRAEQSTSKGLGVKVCISDTGIDLTHPDLQTNIISHFNTINSSKSAKDDNGHGTHVAGTIAAIDNSIGVVGVAPQAKLIAIKGLNRSGSGFTSDLAESIDECRVRGADIINMSWGSSVPATAIHQALIRAHDAGILLIAAAGNNGGAVGYPAAHPEVVAVSATDENDALALFSSFGEKVENSAPGVDIQSTWQGNTYKTISGTSMASPHVAGVAALMLSAGAGDSRDQLLGIDIGLPFIQQGIRGRIDALLTTQP